MFKTVKEAIYSQRFKGRHTQRTKSENITRKYLVYIPIPGKFNLPTTYPSIAISTSPDALLSVFAGTFTAILLLLLANSVCLAFFFALPSSCSVIFPFDGLACLVLLRVAGVVDRWARDWPSRDVEMEVVG